MSKQGKTPLLIAFTVASAFGSAFSQTGSSGHWPARTQYRAGSQTVPPGPRSGAQQLASGVLFLPAAKSFGEPGFHDLLTTVGNLPYDLGKTAGMKLVLTLRDLTRPRQTCSSEHPLSGCATVDWSDNEDRPHVPPGGVFDNSLVVRLAAGRRRFFLSESGLLADKADGFHPG